MQEDAAGGDGGGDQIYDHACVGGRGSLPATL